MLAFAKNTDGNFVITQTIESAIKTEVMTVEYTADLKLSRCNDEPFHPSNKGSRDWFNKHYRKRFDS